MSGTPERRRPGPRGALLALCLGAVATFTAFFMTGTMAPLLAGSLGASPAVIGVIISAAFVVPFFFAIPAGTFVDALGPKPMLLTGAALLTVAPLWVVLAPSLSTLLIVQVFAGFGQLITVVAAQSLVASLGIGEKRERNFGWYGAFVSVGQFVGPLSAGILVDLAGFRSAYAVAAVASGVAALAYGALHLVPVSPVGEDRADAPPAPPDADDPADSDDPDDPDDRPSARSRRRGLGLPSLRELLADAGRPAAQISLWVSGTFMIVLIVHNSFLPAFLGGLAVPASVIGLVISVRSAASVAVRPFMVPVIHALGGRLHSYVLALAGGAIGVAGIVAAPNLATLLVSSVLLGLAVGVAQPLTLVTMVEKVPKATQGVAFGIRITVNRSVQVVTPLLLGLIAQAAGYGPMFVIASLLIASTAVGLWVRRRVYRAIDAG